MGQKMSTIKRKARQPTDRILSDMLETAADLNRHGLISMKDMAELRALCDIPPTYTAERVVEVRTLKARMTQSVFAGFLNVSVSAVQKWESPSSGKHPTGAAAKLLQIIEKKGVEAILG